MWTKNDDVMLSSIENELQTIEEMYLFDLECPDISEKDKENCKSGIQRINKQLMWLDNIKNKIKSNDKIIKNEYF